MPENSTGPVLRVTGASKMTSRADAAAFIVGVEQCHSSAARARAGAARTITSVERKLARAGALVLDFDESLILLEPSEQSQPASDRDLSSVRPGEPERATAPTDATAATWVARSSVRVTAAAAAPLNGLLVELAAVKGATVGPVTYTLRDPDRARSYARKAAVADAMGAARAMAEALGGTLVGLDWVQDRGTPRITGEGQVLHVCCEVAAQYTISAPVGHQHST